ncbi:hypothetical protein V8B97DRAFT_2022238 [Scleroderma yunnanense]
MSQEPKPSPQWKQVDGLQLGPRKRLNVANPLVHHEHHFSRTVHVLCNFQVLLTNRLLQMGRLDDVPEENFTVEERCKHCLEEYLMAGLEEKVDIVSELLSKGTSGARGDDTKSLKGAVLDWITPRGQDLVLPLACNMKVNCSFNHKQTGALLCPAGLDWSNPEIKAKLWNGEIVISEDPWNSLFCSAPLVSAYKHVFTSPITPSSITYIATQLLNINVRSDFSVFLCMDTVMDSEQFYNLLLELFEDPDEKQQVNELLVWWNRKIFPAYSTAQCPPMRNSTLARIQERCVCIKTVVNTLDINF